jgi:hypothetical protein
LKTFEYITQILPDGHIPIPEAILKKLNLKTQSKIRISISRIENQKKGLAYFDGKWQDDRDADEIVEDIYESRKRNIRSERSEL